MKHRGKTLIPLLGGILIGALLVEPAAQAASEYFQAQRTPHPVYVDGQQVQMETYTINGSNYVKLRDIGEKVGFEVYWDGSAAQIVSDQPYTGLPPIQHLVSTTATIDQYDSAQANPAVFTPELTKEMYQGFRNAMLHQREIAAGTYAPTQLGVLSSEKYLTLDKTLKITDILDSLDGEYSYATTQQRDGTVICMVSTFEPIKDAVEQTKPFISGLVELTQREQVEKIVWYICDHLTYNAQAYSGPTSEIFVDGVVIEGKCDTYAAWMKLLCEQARIPCVKLRSNDHVWNCVYVDEKWWDVDVSWDDENKRIESVPSQVAAHRQQEIIFHEPDGWGDEHHKPCNPDSILFTKELLVPGSAK